MHQHLIVETLDEEVIDILKAAQSKVNELWAAQKLPKFIQFGKDDKGCHSHALNGPAAKEALRSPTLIIQTIEAMQPVYDMLELKRYEVGQKIVKKVVVRAQQGSKGKSQAKAVKARKKKERGATFTCVGAPKAANIDSEEEEELDQEPM